MWGYYKTRGLEITISGNVIKNNDFSWHTSLNASYNQNKIIDLYDGDELFLRNEGRDPYPTYKVGMPVDIIYGLEHLGINAIDGMPRYRREDGSQFGSEHKAERGDFKILGHSTPPIQGGWTHHFRYQRWRLSIQLYYNFGGIAQYSTNTSIRDEDDANKNGFAGQLAKTWLKLGDSGKVYKDMFGKKGHMTWNRLFASTRTVGSTDFVRINNIALRYDFSSKTIKKIAPFFRSGQLMGQMKNVATFSNFGGGDPESAELIGEVQPIITLGANFSF